MLTFLAWIVFIPALFWNILIFWFAFNDIMSSDRVSQWATWKNFRDLMISLAFLFVPGVYLFGWY